MGAGNDATTGQVVSQNLYSCYVLYADAYELGTTDQYSDLSLDVSIDTEKSNERFLYALVSRESMRVWDEGIVRMFFAGPGQPLTVK